MDLKTNQKGGTGLIIGVVTVVIVAGLLGIAAYLRANQTEGGSFVDEIFPDTNQNTGGSATSSNSSGNNNNGNGGSNTSSKVFSGSVVTGFEGVNSTIKYDLTYPSPTFSVSASQNTITLKEGGKTHTISFFNNDGAGFANSQEVYGGTDATTYCAGCAAVSTNFKPSAGTDVKMWQSSTREVIIYKHAPGYVIIKLARPSDAARAVAQSLKLNVSTTNSQTETMSIKLHLVTAAASSCEVTTAVNRTIPRTATPATAAINLLLQEGSYPAGSKLNTIRITGTTAYADFNTATESGGGSCAMAARVAQIRNTLLQFPTITKVVITVAGKSEAESFQP